MNIPKKINILGVDYEILLLDYISKEGLTAGQIEYLEQQIKIMNNLSEDVMQVTLIHEIIHGILTQLGFEMESQDERLIQSLATGIYQVFKDNKLL